MSKEAVGQNGAILGSSDYWDRLNRSTYISTAMQKHQNPNTLRRLKESGKKQHRLLTQFMTISKRTKRSFATFRSVIEVLCHTKFRP